MVLFISSLQNTMPIRLFSHLMLKPRWNAIKWKGEIYTIQFHLDYFLNYFNISCYCFSSSIKSFLFLQLITFQLFLWLFRSHLDYFFNFFQFHLACIYVFLYNCFNHILMILSNMSITLWPITILSIISNPTPGQDLVHAFERLKCHNLVVK